MKAILMSIRPKYVAKILNGIKKREIRSKFPSDYVGWVYIYCTKEEYLICDLYTGKARYHNIPKGKNGFTSSGKVVARFWCDKVDEYINGSKIAFENGTYIFGTNADFETILKPSCLTEDELYDYCDDLSFKAIHITKLEIFYTPKELSEFKKCYRSKGYPQNQSWYLTKAPQNYCWLEVEE